ncbi:MerR family transcriptional regulator [Herbidospora daliensis]|uniref:MerR family transcriptional regulator n=1 Tax=Herbidospora daliensis TaxID=295585 RepID=UPI0007822E6A|nr:MerR family transcriptional regulator [Herbidospora daliensis]
MDETWTIAELAERATAALAGLAPANGRVSDVPNERLIRYYTTIGLLDPPLARRGRIALYGRRHLLQLVAIRRRQAEGLSNAAIQQDLLGATDARLTELAGGDLPAPDRPAAAEGGRQEPSRNGHSQPTDPGPRQRFWTSTPTSATASATTTRTAAAAPKGLGTPPPGTFPPVFHGVGLAPGAALLLSRQLDDHELAAVTLAARPLIELLTDLGFTEGIPS